MKARSACAIAVVIVGALSVASCSGASGGSTSGEYASDGTFVTTIKEDPGNLNPLVTNKVAAQIVGAYAYDSLVDIETTPGQVRSYLAESWEEMPQKVSYTLHQGITCSDGASFTARSAADNINWIADPANGSSLRGKVVPASAVATAQGNTVTVETSEPAPFLFNSIGSLKLACSGALADPNSVKTASNGTGLFEITEVVANDHITLKRRSGYAWGPNGETTSETVGVPKTVTIKIVTDPSTTANLLLSKGVNAATVTGADEERMETAGLESRSYVTMTDQFIFNQFDGTPAADPAVRKALLQAADLDAYTKIATASKGERAQSLAVIEPRACRYDSVEGSLPPVDTASAAKTLEAAGWAVDADGKRSKDGRPLEISVVYINSVDAKAGAAEYLAKQWEAIGARVELRGGDDSFVLANTFSATDRSAWGVAVGLTIQSNTPTTFPAYFSGPVPPDGTNFAFVENTKYSEAVAKAVSLQGQESCPVWEQAERALFDSVDVVPVAVAPNNMYFNGAESLGSPFAGVVPGASIRILR
ncbi:ABC transporter substrate-binding protein [Rhodococcus baikonurensis]|uniref:ABC transporter substrate-binding protein n=1 Tax=Rhodococcus baikonurensis TaxID=172041 RepID=UPI0037B2A679